MREVGKVRYDSGQYTDDNMLLKFGLKDPSMMDRGLTLLYGRESDRFPLLTLTQGQGSITTYKSNGGDTQYYWYVQGRPRCTTRVRRLVDATNLTPGKNFGTIEVEFEDNWLITQHTAIAPSGVQYRIQDDGRETGAGSYIYRLTIISADPNACSPVSDFTSGKSWGLGAPSIPASKSQGNRSNKEAPMKAKNQYQYYRYSKDIAGNASNDVVNIQFDLDGGGTTNLWMPYEMKLWELTRRFQLEEDLWFGEYNRDSNGIIHLKDDKTGEVVPKGAGIKDILKAVGNYETYSTLSRNRIDRIINRLYDSRIDSEVNEIVLYAGRGFQNEFDNALKRDAQLNNYFTPMGSAEIRSNGGYMLDYGSYFTSYRLRNGKIITMKDADVFNNGIQATMDRENGNILNGLPVSSYSAVFLDHSMGSNGKRNIQYVCEEGRQFKARIYEGMGELPEMWKAVAKSANDGKISDRQDIASYEVLGSQGINMSNPTTSFWMDMLP